MQKEYITWNDVNEFLDIVKQDKKLIWNSDLFGIYRGGLVLATAVSNYIDSPFDIIVYQTRDGSGKFSLLSTEEHERTYQCVIFEDIIETGKTIRKIISELTDTYKYTKIHIYSLICSHSTKKQIHHEYPQVKIVNLRYYIPDTWYQFPWEPLN